jgi:hypothetical protein
MSADKPRIRQPLWRLLLRFPARAWSMSGTMVEATFRRGPKDPWALPVRILMTILLILTLPILVPLARLKLLQRRRRRFEAHVEQYWKTEPHRGLAILRDVYWRLQKMQLEPGRRVEIPPHGRFGLFDQVDVGLQLYGWEKALGNFDEALAVMASLTPSHISVMRQVDCLLAMHREAEAIALLERSLHLDNWKHELAARLAALAGSSRRGFN